MRPEKPYEPEWQRIVSALLYLQIHEEKPQDFLKLSHIEGALRSNYPATKKLLRYLIEQGFVLKNEEGKTYHITREGDDWLHRAMPVFEQSYRKQVERIRERIR